MIRALLALLVLLAAPLATAEQLPKYSSIAEFYLEVAKGNVPGHEYIAKFGENMDIDAGFEVIWDGGNDYTPPTSASTHNVVSSLAADAGTVITGGTATGGSVTSLEDSSAPFGAVAIGDAVLNDTNVELGFVTAVTSTSELAIARAMRDPDLGLDGEPNESGDAYRIVRDASTGVSILRILGLDAFFLPLDEFVVLNGLSNVPTIGVYSWQYRARVFSSASSNAAGTVTSTAVAGGTISLQVVNGNNQTLMAIYPIPADKVGLLVRWWGSMSKKQSASSVIVLRVGQKDKIGYIHQIRSVNSLGSSKFDHTFVFPQIFPGGSVLWMEADSSTTDVGIAGGFDVLLVDQKLF